MNAPLCAQDYAERARARLDPAVRLELAVAPDGITLARLELPPEGGR